MRNKLLAIWRIILSRQYLVLSDSSVTSSYFYHNEYGNMIKKLAEIIQDTTKPKNENSKKIYK